MRSFFASLAALVVLAAVIGGAFVLSGAYNISADAPHTAPTLAMVELLRDRSIANHASDIEAPTDLDDPERIRRGAGNYDAMCANCHLSPGVNATELSIGLYPSPPNFSEQVTRPPEEAFWITKHGIKATGMPAWGQVMPDDYIWDMVAFLEQLPEMDQEEYDSLLVQSPGHSHGGAEEGGASTEHVHADGEVHTH